MLVFGESRRGPERQRFMRRLAMCLIPLLALLAAACTAGGGLAGSGGHGETVYRDGAGWVIEVPAGWHVVRFSVSKGGVDSAGAQFSNVRLPAPSVLPGYPIQVNDLVLPSGGVGLIIATDGDPRLSRSPIAVPPLRYPDGWSTGSALAGTPYLRTLWFRGSGEIFIASVKVGPKIGSEAPGAALRALAGIIRSIRFEREGSQSAFPRFM